MMAVVWIVAPFSLVKFADVSEMLVASIIALMKEEANTSETSIKQPRRESFS
jgi:hypothetical protein